MLRPSSAPNLLARGRDPVHIASARHDNQFAIAVLTILPQRARVKMYFHLQGGNVRAPDIPSFVRKVHRAVGRDLYVVWDPPQR